ncbi:IS66 family insertion sequence element accessory protein TnpA [Acidithiobacillus sp.]
MNRHQRRQAYSQGKIREWAQSGQPVSAWCAEHGVSPGCFYLWRRRLQECNGRQPDLPCQPSRASFPLLRLPHEWRDDHALDTPLEGSIRSDPDESP